MTYRATNESTDLSADDRIAEARRILFDMGLELEADRMSEQERRFIETLGKGITCREDGRPVQVSVKQLWWLRDLKDKYLL